MNSRYRIEREITTTPLWVGLCYLRSTSENKQKRLVAKSWRDSQKRKTIATRFLCLDPTVDLSKKLDLATSRISKKKNSCHHEENQNEVDCFSGKQRAAWRSSVRFIMGILAQKGVGTAAIARETEVSRSRNFFGGRGSGRGFAPRTNSILCISTTPQEF